MRDATQGRVLFILSLLAMIAYFWAVFLSNPEAEFLKNPLRTLNQWAVIIPVLIFVYLFLFVVAWIGWAMATTPPPLLLKEKKEENKEEK